MGGKYYCGSDTLVRHLSQEQAQFHWIEIRSLTTQPLILQCKTCRARVSDPHKSYPHRSDQNKQKSSPVFTGPPQKRLDGRDQLRQAKQRGSIEDLG
jgi:hypothetical protein